MVTGSSAFVQSKPVLLGKDADDYENLVEYVECVRAGCGTHRTQLPY